ncbi:peptidylprolyl isomerase [Pseudotenacibaculum sp. MALMAid0570]|uniref:peptidylprolyl isomerase n=1 Tax=Pseudotenacibaculum sp. MALMAid0570 TaxID=3143938 RepID=UPI0032DF3F53
MAILSKIRERSVALIAVIGLALFAFVLDPSTLSDFFNSSKVNEVGEVGGESISRQEYAEAVDSYKTRTQNRATEMQAANAVWNNLLREKIYNQQLEEAGVTIGESDVWNQLISYPSVSQNPQFFNEAGLFDEDKFKQFWIDIRSREDQTLAKAWEDYKDLIALNLKRDTYNNLVTAGLGASLQEGKDTYNEENTLMSADFVYVPYTSIADSLINVSKSDIEAYVKSHPNEFQVEESRDLSFVLFEIKATEGDKNDIKNQVAGFLQDTEDRNGIKIEGFKNTSDYSTFFDENESDLPLVENYVLEAQLPTVISQQVVAGNVNDTFGPYEEGNNYKISKIVDIVKRPDSVNSSYILIPHVGAARAGADVTQTVEQARATADSIFKLVRNNKKKFAEMASKFNTDNSKDKGGEFGWINHQNAFSPRFDKDYAEFIFNNKKGKVEVIKTAFGFHIIRIDDQKNKQNAYKLITFGKEIKASQATEDAVFQEAETFALSIMDGNTNKFYSAAREKNYTTRPAVGLKVLDDKLPSLPRTNNRPVITWAFSKDTKQGDFKRFDTEGGYIVATLVGKTEKGLMPVTKATGRVKPLLLNEKKAKLIREKMSGATLNDIATSNKITVRKANDVALKSPSITGVGFEPNVVGAMYYAKENQLYKGIDGNKGVFAFVITKKTKPTELPNYESTRQRLAQERKSRTGNIFEALKKSSDIEDYRALFYGVNQ